jgi:uracil-DNA glycosylase
VPIAQQQHRDQCGHIRVLTAFAEVPTKVLIFRFCLRTLKNSSICQRSFSMAVMVGEKDKNAARILADGLDAAQLEKLAGLLLTGGYGADFMEACHASLRLHCA